LIITYDEQRGEPRGARKKGTDPKAKGLGDCVDCTLCVQVCPTGIDIRKGLQYECIGCAACIDVCDGVMDKMNYPRGLVRYDTLNGMQKHLSRGQELTRVFRPRVVVYTSILGLILVALGISMAMRSPFKVDVVRDRGTLARVVEDGWVENVYRLQIMNTTESVQRYRIGAAGLPSMATDLKAEVVVEPAQARWVAVAVRVSPEAAAQAGPGSHRLEFVVERVGVAAEALSSYKLVEKSTFMVPR
jgi:cytochrome c oxidase accessory protein FixG